MKLQPTPAGTAHAGSRLEITNTSNVQPTIRVDAFTDFINEWINTNIKVFTQKENNHDSEVL